MWTDYQTVHLPDSPVSFVFFLFFILFSNALNLVLDIIMKQFQLNSNIHIYIVGLRLQEMEKMHNLNTSQVQSVMCRKHSLNSCLLNLLL